MKYALVFAHPDDESFTCSGTVPKLTKNGHEVILITATRGEAGLTGTPPICEKKDLGKVRENELKCAAKVLGISKIFFLDFIDGTLVKQPLSSITEKIFSLFESEKPDFVITFDSFGGSGHPDHKTISKAATGAFSKYMAIEKKHVRLYHTAVPSSWIREMAKKGFVKTSYGKRKGTPDDRISTKININNTFDYKIKALQCHRTQNKDWPGYLERMGQVKDKFEYFRLVTENKI
jgi:LmbE family N-acetylglucosaminyl deacetylase